MAALTSTVRKDGYLPIRDYGLIGNGLTAALVGRDGAIDWMCLPRFDSPPLFCSILDSHHGGSFHVAPLDLAESRQHYLGHTGVLVTEMHTASARLEVTDAMTFRPGANLAKDRIVSREELLRQVVVLYGDVDLHFDLSPYGGADTEKVDGRLRLRCHRLPGLDIVFAATLPLEGMSGNVRMRTGDRITFVLTWSTASTEAKSVDIHSALRGTVAAWERWINNFQYEGPQLDMVRRSAVTLKLLNHFPNGAIVAAPTSSLPEWIGGLRNWDYRYAWVRDAAFSVYALHRIGHSREAGFFLNWVLDSISRDKHASVAYDLSGRPLTYESEDASLEGYRGSHPVRWGNAAGKQEQHDVYGEILDCAYQWARHHGTLDPAIWKKLRILIESARRLWKQPDKGIWEVRSAGRIFTYSVALCHVALDRGVRLSKAYGLKGDTQAWQACANEIRETILQDAWDPKRQTLTESIGGHGLDASLLSLPLRRVIEATHPRMKATTEAIQRWLDAGHGLLYRYRNDESPDGLPPGENAFLLCSFWLVDNLTMQGRLQEAIDLYDSLCAKANGLGLLPEQMDPDTGEFVGNYPQGLSHIGVISSGVNLANALRKNEMACS
jgi:alpha,alpha-trehalase